MFKNKIKLASGLLAAVMLFTGPVSSVSTAFAASVNTTLPGAAFTPVKLHAAPTKEMTYYKTGDASIPADIQWVTNSSALDYLPQAVIGDVTCAVKDAEGVYWIGTFNGLQRVNFEENDSRDIVQYMAGPRYLYGGDDVVTAVASDNAGGVWVKTASGVTHIAMPKKTMLERTYVYSKLTNDINERFGLVEGAGFTFSDPNNTSVNYGSETGKFTSNAKTSDNDGLWTAMYAIGEIFRYKTLKEDYGSNPTEQQKAEITAAKAAALRASKAVLLLDYVSGRDNGFPTRSFMLTSEVAAKTADGTDYSFQSQNGFWFHSIIGETNPNGIIPSMKSAEGKEPIGYSIVRVTKDAESKKGSKLFPSGGYDVMNYNGIALSQEAIDELNKTRPEGSKLGIDIKTQVDKDASGNPIYQVLPVITNATNNTNAKEDKTTNSTTNKPLFQLTTPIYERIPQFFNDLFPASAIGADGYIDQNQIVYKADTSSDEVGAHYALFFTAYTYLCDDESDAQLVELKSLISDTARKMTKLIIKDDHYYVEDATGKSTQWSRWLSKYFNDSLSTMEKQVQWKSNVGVDGNGEDALSYGFEDGPLNVLQIMAALKTAITVTDQAYSDDIATFKAAYDLAYDASYSKEEPFISPKGYIQIAKEYIERRLTRQATNAYANNGNTIVDPSNPNYTGDIQEDSNTNGTIHKDWTQYINYSDENLGWLPVYQLILQEKDPDRYAQIVEAYDEWYQNERREENPSYTFLYQIANPDDTTVDLQSAVRFLYRMPQYRVNFAVQNARQDVLYIEPGDRDDYVQMNYAVPPDERYVHKNNNNPFEAADGEYTANPNYNYATGTMEGGLVFSIPYWIGRYFGIIEEADNAHEKYTQKLMSVTLESNTDQVIKNEQIILTATVKGDDKPLQNVIVDFKDGQKWIGRIRTDENGVAVLTTKASADATYTAVTTERLIGNSMYLTTTSPEKQVQVVGDGFVKITAPDNCEMLVGESRSLQTIIVPADFTCRTLIWSSDDEAKAVVDKYGRVTALATGEVKIKAEIDTDGLYDTMASEIVINIVDAATQGLFNKSAVSYTASDAATAEDNLQKLVDRYTLAEASADANVPEEVKSYIADTSVGGATEVTDAQGTVWKVESYGIVRTQANEANDRDKVQYFMNQRYLPAGTIGFISSDNNNGLWVVSDSGVTHIRMETMSYQEKAIIMSDASQKYVSRRGMVSQASRDASAPNGWRPQETDNDGLWTSMYGVGELYRYAELKKAFEAGDATVTQQMVDDAKAVATKSAEAVLLLGNISMRTGTVDAKVRYMTNESNQMSGNALLKGKDYAVFSPVVGPAGGDRFGTNHSQGEQSVFNPVNLLDWLDPRTAPEGTEFETRKRSLSGFIARTYRLAGLEGEDAGAGSYNDGYYYDVTGNTATCLDTTSTKVKWEKLAGVTVDASGTVPERLAKLYNTVTNPLTGQPFSKDDIIYKGDTSTDELIGHLFIYKVAYDVLGAEDPELKQIISDTVRNLALHYVDNGYGLKDATGQSTTWGKTDRDYFNNSYAWEDCSLSAMVVLNAFKLAGYVTGEQRWEDEYRMLALEAPYEYAKLAGEYWERWVYYAIEDGCDANNQEEINEWIQQNLNYSDEEMAMLAYYLIFQMESDNALLEKYRTGLDAWWNSMKYSENPLWYYIYQLAYPETTVKDAYGNNLIDTASWALKRHPVDTITWNAYTAGRPGVTQDGELSKDEAGNITVVPQDERNLHKFNGSTYELEGGNSNKMEGSTTYTLPYWLGRYHNMIK